MYRVLVIPNETAWARCISRDKRYKRASGSLILLECHASYTAIVQLYWTHRNRSLFGVRGFGRGSHGFRREWRGCQLFSESLVGGGDGWGLQKIDYQWRVTIRILQNRMGDQVLNSSDAPLPRHPAIDNDQSLASLKIEPSLLLLCFDTLQIRLE